MRKRRRREKTPADDKRTEPSLLATLTVKGEPVAAAAVPRGYILVHLFVWYKKFITLVGGSRRSPTEEEVAVVVDYNNNININNDKMPSCDDREADSLTSFVGKRGNDKLYKTEHFNVVKNYGYTLGNIIGKGSFAVVKEAIKDQDNQKFAVKIINKKQKNTGELMKKFIPREMEVMKKLHHPTLVNFYQAIETNRRLYIIMEFVPNGTLLEKIKKEKSINEVQARKWFIQILSALDYLHKKGIIHRDIKCENILLDSDENIKVSDFGFSKGDYFETNGSYPQCETYCGSFCYACPEIVKGIPYNGILADVWSLGVVLYAMLYGRLPYEETSVAKLIKKMEQRVKFFKNPPITMCGKDMIAWLLSDYTSRPMLSAIWNHKWLTDPIEDQLKHILPVTNIKGLLRALLRAVWNKPAKQEDFPFNQLESRAWVADKSPTESQLGPIKNHGEVLNEGLKEGIVAP